LVQAPRIFTAASHKDQLVIDKEMIVVYSENQMKHKYALLAKFEVIKH